MEYVIKKKKIKLITNSNVFKPTQTSKYLLDGIIKDYKFKKIVALDMGCGNGIIGITLLKIFANPIPDINCSAHKALPQFINGQLIWVLISSSVGYGKG